MMRIVVLALSLVISAPVLAVMDYPVNIDEWAGRTAYLDMDTGQITERGDDWPATDPDTYLCPVCGINPGWPANIAPLRELDKPVIPDYDSNLYSLSLIEVICGPDPGTLDANCGGQTDVIAKIWDTSLRQVVDQRQAAKNVAAYQAFLQLPEDQFRLHVLVQLGLNMMRLDSSALPPKWQAVNDAHQAWLINKILPIWERRKELLNAVDAQTITGGDMDTGWPTVQGSDLPE